MERCPRGWLVFLPADPADPAGQHWPQPHHQTPGGRPVDVGAPGSHSCPQSPAGASLGGPTWKADMASQTDLLVACSPIVQPFRSPSPATAAGSLRPRTNLGGLFLP